MSQIRLNDSDVAVAYAIACSSEDMGSCLEQLKEVWVDRIAEESPPEPHPSAEELAAISYYRSEAYSDINEYLRNGTLPEFGSPESVMAITRLICSALNKMPASQRPERTVFRGVWLKPEDIEKQFAAGTVFTEKAFTSTALTRHIADEFAYGAEAPFRSVVFEIEHKNGVLVTCYLTMDDMFEAEVLFPPGTSFQVLSHETDEYDYIIIKMVEVP